MGKVLSYILVLLIVLGGSGLLLARSADASKPGESLYKIDLIAEAIQRTFTFGDIAKAQFEQDILDERSQELKMLMAKGSDEVILGDAVNYLDLQRVRAEERVQALISEESNYDEAELARIRTRLERQLEEQLHNMEMVRVKFQEKTFKNEEAKENFQEAQQNFEKAQQNFQEAVQKMNEAKSKGNSEQNVNDDAGDGVNNKESNR